MSFRKDFKQFYESYYDIGDDKVLTIEYETLHNYSRELAERLRDEPERILSDAEDALSEVSGNDTVQVLVDGYDAIEVGIRELRDRHIGKFVRIDGIVSQVTSVLPMADVAVFECRDGHITEVNQRLDTDLEYPRECGHEDCTVRRDSDFKMQVRPTEIINFQKIELQEPHDEVQGGETPESITVNVKGEVAGQITAGDRISTCGIYKAVEQSGSSVFRTFISGNTIEAEQQEFEDIEITDEEIEKIKKLAEREDIYTDLIDSIAPTIQGLRREKEACVYQLFRGIRKTKLNSPIRGDIHILMVGDPSVGKSQLLRYVSKVAPRSVMTSGKGSSEAGLTVSAVRDSDIGGEEEWKLKAGAMVMADEGIACIDEIDKMSSSDRSALHQGMEQQTISVAKAGITATLKSRCAMLAAANPKQGRWNEFDPIAAQIDLDPPLISRFDLIFAPTDDKGEQEDRELAKHILQTNQYGQEMEAGVEPTHENQDIVPTIEPDLLKKYIAYARSNCDPVMTEEAREHLQEFFVEIRSQGEDDAIPITARKIEGLVRISEAAARIQLSDTVDIEHAQRAIELVKESLKDVGFDEEAGEFDIDKIESGNTATQRDRINHLRRVVNELENEGEKAAPKQLVIDEMVEIGFDERKIEETIDKQTRAGELFEPVNGELSVL